MQHAYFVYLAQSICQSLLTQYPAIQDTRERARSATEQTPTKRTVRDVIKSQYEILNGAVEHGLTVIASALETLKTTLAQNNELAVHKAAYQTYNGIIEEQNTTLYDLSRRILQTIVDTYPQGAALPRILQTHHLVELLQNVLSNIILPAIRKDYTFLSENLRARNIGLIENYSAQLKTRVADSYMMPKINALCPRISTAGEKDVPFFTDLTEAASHSLEERYSFLQNRSLYLKHMKIKGATHQDAETLLLIYDALRAVYTRFPADLLKQEQAEQKIEEANHKIVVYEKNARVCLQSMMSLLPTTNLKPLPFTFEMLDSLSEEIYQDEKLSDAQNKKRFITLSYLRIPESEPRKKLEHFIYHPTRQKRRCATLAGGFVGIIPGGITALLSTMGVIGFDWLSLGILLMGVGMLIGVISGYKMHQYLQRNKHLCETTTTILFACIFAGALLGGGITALLMGLSILPWHLSTAMQAFFITAATVIGSAAGAKAARPITHWFANRVPHIAELNAVVVDYGALDDTRRANRIRRMQSQGNQA